MRLDLTEKDHVALVRDAEIRGLAGLFHQPPHDVAARLDKVAATQERAADAEGLDADHPFLRGLIELGDAVFLHGHEQAVRG